MSRLRREQIVGLLMTLPALLLLSIFFLYPLFNSFWMSLHKWPLFGKPKWVGLDNYVWMINDERFWQCLKFTLVYTITVTPMLFIVAIGTALLCNVKTWGTTFFRSIYFLPVVMSFATASFVWLWLYSEWYGVIIFLLKAIGFGPEDGQLSVWTDGWTAMWAVNTMVTWKFAGIQMIILIAGLQSIRDDYYEASRLMGASRFQTIWNITLPLLRPSIALALILSIAGSIQAYEQFQIMTRGGPMNETKTLVMLTIGMGFDYFKLGPAAALGVIIMSILFVITLIQLRLFRKAY
jgi:multiple sugar transport system permease protein|tara:strand:- start:39 stop:917 length:879 start_codon:yes stop_codon:yes gene_type:complete